MRPWSGILLALAALAAAPSAWAQWEIFAERMPEDGSWASYRMTATEEGQPDRTTEIRVSSRDGTTVQGCPASGWRSSRSSGWGSATRAG